MFLKLWNNTFDAGEWNYKAAIRIKAIFGVMKLEPNKKDLVPNNPGLLGRVYGVMTLQSITENSYPPLN